MSPKAILEEKKRTKADDLRHRQTAEARKQQEELLGEVLATDSSTARDELEPFKEEPGSIFESKDRKHVSFMPGDVSPSSQHTNVPSSGVSPSVAVIEDCNTQSESIVRKMLSSIQNPADIYKVMTEVSRSVDSVSSPKLTREETESQERKAILSNPIIPPLESGNKPLKSAIKLSTASDKTSKQTNPPTITSRGGGSKQQVNPNVRRALAAQKQLQQREQIVKAKVQEKDPPPPSIPSTAEANINSDNDWPTPVLSKQDLAALSKELQRIPASVAGGWPTSKYKANQTLKLGHSYHDSDSYDDDDDDDDDMEMANRIRNELAEFENAYADQVVWEDVDSEKSSDEEPYNWKPAPKEPPKLKLSIMKAGDLVEEARGGSEVHVTSENATKGISNVNDNRNSYNAQFIASGATSRASSEDDTKPPASRFKQQRMNRLH